MDRKSLVKKGGATLALSPRATSKHVQAVLMAVSGKSYKTIAEATGMSASQVGHLLHDMGLKVSEYRNDQNDLAKQVTQSNADQAEEYFAKWKAGIESRLKELKNI
jgi:pyruvate/oxaloacetate carboxyltransferase